MKQELHFIELSGKSIEEQLQYEEFLLRSDDRNICIVSDGSPRTIVMGISGNPQELLNLEKVHEDKIPVIRRFSGGGTVIVDENTLFVTWILSKESFPLTPFPEPILRWTASVYEQAWQIPGFLLRENDYAIFDRKCGGNAQYIRKTRFLHHTSFLWDYTQENMEYLLLPSKRPQYRLNRSHADFLTPLKHHASSKADLIALLRKTVGSLFDVK